MSLEDLGNALQAQAEADSEYTLRKLSLKLREIDKGTFETVPCPWPEVRLSLPWEQVPQLCRKQAAVWTKLQQKCIPAAERRTSRPRT